MELTSIFVTPFVDVPSIFIPLQIENFKIADPKNIQYISKIKLCMETHAQISTDKT